MRPGGSASQRLTGARRVSPSDNALTLVDAESVSCVGGRNAGSQSLGRDADPSQPTKKTHEEKTDVIVRGHPAVVVDGGAGTGLMALRPVPRVSTA